MKNVVRRCASGQEFVCGGDDGRRTDKLYGAGDVVAGYVDSMVQGFGLLLMKKLYGRCPLIRGGGFPR